MLFRDSDSYLLWPFSKNWREVEKETLTQGNLEQYPLSAMCGLAERVGLQRSCHHAQAQGAMEDFKKASQCAWKKWRATGLQYRREKPAARGGRHTGRQR